VIGESDSYRMLMGRQANVGKICDPDTHRRVGIDLYTWKVDDMFAGAKISNVRLQGYNRTTCPIASSIKYNTHVSKVKQKKYHSGNEKSNICCMSNLIPELTFYNIIVITFHNCNVSDSNARRIRLLHVI
jgi:hypothetical protein